MVASMTLISQPDRDRISAAIAAAEEGTSGEIVAVVTAASDDYRFIPLLWAALLALLVPLPLILWTQWPVQHIYAAQLLCFAVLGAVAQWWPLRVALVPGLIKRSRAHRHAVDQFLAQNLHTTAGRTGVLIFVSMAERFAEVIADAGIHEKVPQGAWEDIVEGLTKRIGRGETADGFIQTINACGALLAEHYPPGTVDENELPDHLIVL